jgi:hypothetical protein
LTHHQVTGIYSACAWRDLRDIMTTITLHHKHHLLHSTRSGNANRLIVIRSPSGLQGICRRLQYLSVGSRFKLCITASVRCPQGYFASSMCCSLFGVTFQVTGIYSASAWRHINEHLHDILGKQSHVLHPSFAWAAVSHSSPLHVSLANATC